MPSLGPDNLCRETAMTSSQLSCIIKREGGEADYIKRRKRRRPSESFVLLSDVPNTLAVDNITEVLRCVDASSFSQLRLGKVMELGKGSFDD